MSNDIEKYTECPFCNSKNISFQERNEVVSEPYGYEEKLVNEFLVCNDCGEEISITENFTNIYTKTLELSRKNSVSNIINKLDNDGYNLTEIERALKLPKRTLSRWKTGNDINAAGLALLRIVGSYPWILKVAKRNFDRNSVVSIFIENATVLNMRIATQNGFLGHVDREVIDHEKVTYTAKTSVDHSSKRIISNNQSDYHIFVGA